MQFQTVTIHTHTHIWYICFLNSKRAKISSIYSHSSLYLPVPTLLYIYLSPLCSTSLCPHSDLQSASIWSTSICPSFCSPTLLYIYLSLTLLYIYLSPTLLYVYLSPLCSTSMCLLLCSTSICPYSALHLSVSHSALHLYVPTLLHIYLSPTLPYVYLSSLCSTSICLPICSPSICPNSTLHLSVPHSALHLSFFTLLYIYLSSLCSTSVFSSHCNTSICPHSALHLSVPHSTLHLLVPALPYVYLYPRCSISICPPFARCHKRRIQTEEKAKFFAAAWGLNWCNSLPRQLFCTKTISRKRMNCTRTIWRIGWIFKSSWSKTAFAAWNWINYVPPVQQRRPFSFSSVFILLLYARCSPSDHMSTGEDRPRVL